MSDISGPGVGGQVGWRDTWSGGAQVWHSRRLNLLGFVRVALALPIAMPCDRALILGYGAVSFVGRGDERVAGCRCLL